MSCRPILYPVAHFRTRTRKTCGMLALFVPAVLLVVMSYLDHNLPVLVLMNIAMFFQGFANCSYYFNYMDLSPRFSAVLCGIGNGLCAVAGFVGPVFIGMLTNGIPEGEHERLHRQWQKAFISASGVWAVGALQFCVFGSAEIQPWNDFGEKDEGGEEEEEGYGNQHSKKI